MPLDTYRLEIRPSGLTDRQRQAIMSLVQFGSTTRAESFPEDIRTLESLVNKGLVSTDKRHWRYRITPAGRALERRI